MPSIRYEGREAQREWPADDHAERKGYSYSHDISRRVGVALKRKWDAFPSPNASKTPLPPPQQHI